MNVSSLKTVFFGNNLQLLECLSSESEVIAVFTRPDDGTNENVNSIRSFSASAGIPIFQPSKKELYGYVEFLEKAAPDLIIVCGYKFIIPREIFSIPKDGTINIHPSMLPRYRGQHVINWAIINGESETGVTLHFMEETLDTGDIIIQKAIPIDIKDTAKDLHDRIYAHAYDLLKEVLRDCKQGKKLTGKSQEETAATFFKPRRPEDGHIDWRRSSAEIYNLIRGLSKPWPGAYTYSGSNKMIIWKAYIGSDNCEGTCGKIINADNDYIAVSTNNGQIIITNYDIIKDDSVSNLQTLFLKKGDTLT